MIVLSSSSLFNGRSYFIGYLRILETFVETALEVTQHVQTTWHSSYRGVIKLVL